jgi:Family of unknown function (DUF5678)
MSEHFKELDMADVLRQQVQAEKELSKSLEDYAGEWVAVRDHKVVAHAVSVEALMEQVSGEAVEIFEVSAGEGAVVCFF